MKEFYTLDVISIAYNRSLNLEGTQGMRDLVDYITGTHVSGDELEKVCKDSMTYLLTNYKILSDTRLAYVIGRLHSSLDLSDKSDADLSKEVKEYFNKYIVPITGEFIKIKPMKIYSLKG